MGLEGSRVFVGDETAYVLLSGGEVCLISPEDADVVSGFRWYKNSRYVRCARNDVPLIHRLILGLEQNDGRVVDHINHNTLDNRRENLRVTDLAGNARNRVTRRDNTTGYKGVRRNRNRFEARCGTGARYIGIFDTAEEAARAYDATARDMFGEFAYVNFPDEGG